MKSRNNRKREREREKKSKNIILIDASIIQSLFSLGLVYIDAINVWTIDFHLLSENSFKYWKKKFVSDTTFGSNDRSIKGI